MILAVDAEGSPTPCTSNSRTSRRHSWRTSSVSSRTWHPVNQTSRAASDSVSVKTPSGYRLVRQHDQELRAHLQIEQHRSSFGNPTIDELRRSLVRWMCFDRRRDD